MTPKELDAQNLIKIDEWVDIDSERWREVDGDPSLTKKIIRLGLEEPPFFIVDSLGRLWGKGTEPGRLYPFHTEYGKKLVGFRISKRAAN
jgi:hypothetical protein